MTCLKRKIAVQLATQTFVKNTASLDLISQPWLGYLSTCASILGSQLHDDLMTIYVRGSIPQGTAIEGLSDIDLIMIVRTPHLYRARSSEIHAQFRQLKLPKVDLEVVAFDSLFPLDQCAGHPLKNVKMRIKVDSVCWSGQDFSKEIPHQTLLDTVTQCYTLDVWHRIESAAQNGGLAPGHCKMMMKRLIRGSYHIAIQEGFVDTFRRELRDIVSVLVNLFPSKSTQLKKCLALYIQPSIDINDLREIHQTIGTWIIESNTVLRYQ